MRHVNRDMLQLPPDRALCEFARVPKLVNFDKYRLACMNGMSISNSWHAMYTQGSWLACMCMPHDVHKMSLHMQ